MIAINVHGATVHANGAVGDRGPFGWLDINYEGNTITYYLSREELIALQGGLATAIDRTRVEECQ